MTLWCVTRLWGVTGVAVEWGHSVTNKPHTSVNANVPHENALYMRAAPATRR